MRFLLVPVLALTIGCSTTEQYAYRTGTTIQLPEVEFDNQPNNSRNKQGPITFTEVSLCHELEYQAYNGPLSWRRNLTGSIGTCDRKSGICAVYWLEYDACDIIDTADMVVDKRAYRPPTPQEKLDNLYQAMEDCYNGGMPRFGPQAPCEVLEAQYIKELEKQGYIQ